MNCFVTGGSGFLGSHVADELTKNNFNVFIFDKKKSKWLQKKQKMIIGDLKDLKKIEPYIKKSDYVFHRIIFLIKSFTMEFTRLFFRWFLCFGTSIFSFNHLLD